MGEYMALGTFREDNEEETGDLTARLSFEHAVDTAAPADDPQQPLIVEGSHHVQMHSHKEADPKQKNRVTFTILNGVMIATYFATTFGMYATGALMPGHIYNVPVWYPIMSLLVCAVLTAISPLARTFLRQEWRKFHVYGPIGLIFSVNYAFVFTASTSVPNLFQVIFMQVTLVFNYFMNKYLLNCQFAPQQPIIIVSVVMFNILLIGNEISFNDSIHWILYWQFVYLIGLLANSLSNILTEAYLKSVRNPLPQPTPTQELEFEYAKVIVINILINMYAFVGVLVLVYMVYPLNGGVSISDFVSSALFTTGSWPFYLSTLGFLAATVSSTILFKYTNYTYTTILCSSASMIQVIVVSLPIVGEELQQVSTLSQYLSYVAITLLSLAFAYYQAEAPEHSAQVQNSKLVQFYLHGTHSKFFYYSLAAFFLVMFAITLPVSMTIRP
eukprot:m.181606 g.181606  ORF g.181606 m.181606 type:complete len:443 (+) comp53472_c0_seq4:159-1487(+)